MRNLLKVVISCFLLFFVMNSYAIQINVRSTSTKIMGLGFTVNGAKHGGPGSKYHATDMPKGTYTFGLRAHGKDIGCFTKDGKKEINLTKNTNAVLKLKGRRCTVDTDAK
jgi:hypothetical protein